MKIRTHLRTIAVLFLSSILASCSFILPNSSSSKQSGTSESEQTTSKASSYQGSPKIHLETDDRLTEYQDNKYYHLNLAAGERYEIHADLGDYQGEDYYLTIFTSLGKFISLEENVIVADDFIPNARTERVTLAVMKVGFDEGYYDVKQIDVDLTKSEGDYAIGFPMDDNTIRKGDDYYLMLTPGEEYDLKPFVEGAMADFDYEFQSYSEDPCFELGKDGHIKMKEDAEVGEYDFLYVMAYYKDSYVKNGFIRVKAAEDYWYIDVGLSSTDERVLVEFVDLSSYAYRITVPHAGVYYPMPEISIAGNKEDVHYGFKNLDEGDEVEFKSEGGKDYFRLIPTSIGYKKFAIVVYNSNEVALKEVAINLLRSNKGPGEYRLYYGEDETEIVSGDTVYLQKDLTYDFEYYFNGKWLRPALNKVEISDDSLFRFIDNFRLLALKTGETTVRVSYSSTDADDVEYVYEIAFTIKVVDNSYIVDIYASGDENAFFFQNNQLYITAHIFVEYDTGATKIVNGDENLSITISNTDRKDQKKVTLRYSEKERTVSREYIVDTSSKKTTITHTYEDAYRQKFSGMLDLKGDLRVLVLPIWLTDSSDFINEERKDAKGLNQKEQVLDDLRAIVFGNNEEVGWRSVKTFYEEESFGAINITGEVAPWYVDDHSSAFYTRNGYEDIMKLLEKAVDSYFESSGKTLADFDANEDGIIDSVMIYYGSNYHETNKYSRAYCLRYRFNGHPRFRNYTWISAMAMYGLSGATDMTRQLNTDDLSSLNAESSYRLINNTTLHEFGHVLGVDDYYDEHRNDNNNNTPGGYFSMQENNVGGHEPYSVMAYGWANPFVYDASTLDSGASFDITIADFQSSHDFIMLTPNYSEEKQAFDEYMLLELFTPTGLNEHYASTNYFDSTGIRLWHVNAPLGEDFDHVNSNDSAKGNYDLLHWIRNAENIPFKGPTSLISHGDYLFKEGDSFSMDRFTTQFYSQNGLLDNGSALGFSFSVKEIEKTAYGAKATIHIVRD